MKKILLILLVIFAIVSCNNSGNDNVAKKLTIFFVNDIHGQLDNFSKIKYIVDAERQTSNVIVACSGDIFSGNPIVDSYEEKGYPVIDAMNKVGFDISVIGNHDFDYGKTTFKSRVEQADFDWVCANVDMGITNLPEPFEYKTIRIDNLNVTFLGLIETDGKEDAVIPSTHPYRVQDMTFERPENVVAQYSNIKAKENSDLYVALTHLGHDGGEGQLGDYQLAEQYPYFDLIIGGHSHRRIDTVINNIPVFQSGSYLNYLGKIEMTVKNKNIETINFELIDLNDFAEFNPELQKIIDGYNSSSNLDEVIGYSQSYHEKNKVGCFYADALRGGMNVEVTFQNTGGVRSSLNEGDITKREVYEIDPFNNGTLSCEMSVSEIKNFLIGTGSGFYYSGIKIEQNDKEIQIKDLNGNILSDDTVLLVGINDYIAAIHDSYLPENGTLRALTSAETIIFYLKNINNNVNYTDCDQYFRYE